MVLVKKVTGVIQGQPEYQAQDFQRSTFCSKVTKALRAQLAPVDFLASEETKERLDSLGCQACLELVACPAPSKGFPEIQALLVPQDCQVYLV